MTQDPRRIEHMARRRAAGLSHKELGQEFEISRQHAGRLLNRKASKEKASQTSSDHYDEEC